MAHQLSCHRRNRPPSTATWLVVATAAAPPHGPNGPTGTSPGCTGTSVVMPSARAQPLINQSVYLQSVCFSVARPGQMFKVPGLRVLCDCSCDLVELMEQAKPCGCVKDRDGWCVALTGLCTGRPGVEARLSRDTLADVALELISVETIPTNTGLGSEHSAEAGLGCLHAVKTFQPAGAGLACPSPAPEDHELAGLGVN